MATRPCSVDPFCCLENTLYGRRFAGQKPSGVHRRPAHRKTAAKCYPQSNGRQPPKLAFSGGHRDPRKEQRRNDGLRALSLAVIILVTAAVGLHSAKAEIALNGQAVLGNAKQQEQLLVRCSVSKKVDIDLIIPFVSVLQKQFDFSAYGGPFARLGNQPLAMLETSGGSASFIASGSIPIFPDNAFRVSVSPGFYGAEKKNAITRIFRPLTESVGTLSWNQRNPVPGRASLQVTFDVPA